MKELPKIGVKYKNKTSGNIIEFSKIDPAFVYIRKDLQAGYDFALDFWDKFEEVPEMIDKVKRATEELRNDIKMKEGFFFDGGVQTNLFNHLMKDIENLLDALDGKDKI